MNVKKTSDIILSAQKIVNRFGNQTVHDDIHLDVRKGEILGIVGGSGSGKSVLLKSLSGLRKPSSGAITLEGKPIETIVSDLSASMLGVLFQEGALFSSLSVAENIMLPLREYTTLTESEQRELAQLKLALVGLPADTAVKYPSQLSGGMARRAALARAIVLDPQILFLDEPTSGLDPVNAAAFDDLILDLNHGLGVTVVMVTHDLNSLFTVCDRVAVLLDKKLLVGTLPEILKNDEAWIQEFFHGLRGQGAAAAARSAHGKR